MADYVDIGRIAKEFDEELKASVATIANSCRAAGAPLTGAAQSVVLSEEGKTGGMLTGPFTTQEKVVSDVLHPAAAPLSTPMACAIINAAGDRHR